MIVPDFAVYLGSEKEDRFSGFIAESNLFLSLETEDGLSNDKGREILQYIKNDIVNSAFSDLAEFEQFFSETFKKLNIPSSFSLAVGYLKGRLFYLKTVGKGKIFLKKRSEFAQIIEKDNSASGYITENDFFIFTTDKFIDLIGGELELRSIFDSKNPHQIVDELTPQLKSKEDAGVIALLVQFLQEKTDQSLSIKENKFKASAGDLYFKIKSYIKRSGIRKILTSAIVLLIFLILIWSVINGLFRKSNSDLSNKIKNTKELVVLKLKQADDVAFLKMSRALVLISEAKVEVNKLKKLTGNKNYKEIAEIEKLISDEENKLVKKENKNYQEFYNLTLVNENAKGDKLFLEGDLLDILDKNEGIVYTLSLSKKSINKKKASEIKSASLIGSNQDKIIIYVEGQGIFETIADNKVKKVIDKDKDWGNVVDFSIYNGNIYLLDSSKDQIYKYISTDNGFSDKNNYFKSGSGISFRNSNSIAIDSSIYIGFNDHILKYTAGVPDDFNTSFPEKVNINKVVTNKDLEKVYAWDKSKGSIYIINKNGTYEREINSKILSQAVDFVAFNGSAYVLLREKIYQINLD